MLTLSSLSMDAIRSKAALANDMLELLRSLSELASDDPGAMELAEAAKILINRAAGSQ